jgi:hypothetical protein
VIQTDYSQLLPEVSFAGALAELDQLLAQQDRLMKLSDILAEAPLASGKWSRKQVLGHLIDSALNNLQRFVRAHNTNTPEEDAPEDGVLNFPGYAQNAWVLVQRHQNSEMMRLLQLWDALNTQIYHVMVATEPATLQTRCRVGKGAPITLEALFIDYVGHLKHHLAQID